jgi:hypothetical protein
LLDSTYKCKSPIIATNSNSLIGFND